MSSNIAITVENISKCYQIYRKPSHRLRQMLMRGRRKYYREFWALRNISFDIYKGETVGIIGCNGSGKSTILQIICGVLNPTEGKIATKGRIAALLELGSGFNPEFTGRENVYMNGSILGLKHDEIDQRFDSIAAFADIGEFIDQPVKMYSSGMMVRLAFAVSVSVDPEILIVDEALSVGDERFQRKCFAKIESIKNNGATVLFVSHSGSAIVQLCDRAILLDQGEMLLLGKPKKIYSSYQKLLNAPAHRTDEIRQEILNSSGEMEDTQSVPLKPDEGKPEDEGLAAMRESYDPNLVPTSTIEYFSRGGKIHSPAIATLSGTRVNQLVRGRRYVYSYHVDFIEDITNVRFGMLIKTTSGLALGGATSAKTNRYALPSVNTGQTLKIAFEFRCSLNPGTYFLNAGVLGECDGEEIYLHRLLDAAMFQVLPEENEKMLTTAIVDFDCSVTHSMKTSC